MATTKSPAPEPLLFSTATRFTHKGFWGRVGTQLGAWFGRKETYGLAGGAILLGASRVFQPTFGAPLSRPVSVAQPSDDILRRLGALKDASSADVPKLLAALTPAQIAALDAACGDGWASSSWSLRELIHARTSGLDTRAALDILDDRLLSLFRGQGPQPHDLRADPSGLDGPSGDGRLPQTIHKLLELRRLKQVDLEDLGHRHEISANNALRLHTTPKRAFARMIEAVESAHDFVHVGFFIWKGGRGRQFADALIKKAQSGVPVRVVLDEIGAWLGSRPRELEDLIALLRAGGVEVCCNRVVDLDRPTGVFSFPDHRKTVIVDGKVGFVGGVNLGDEYVDQWHDLVIEARGDLVHQIHAEWFLGWLGLGGRIDPELDDAQIRARYFPDSEAIGETRAKVIQVIPGVSPEILSSMLQLIGRAEHTIDIENPYITEAQIHAALELALSKGRKVRIIIPAENNHFFCDLVARPAFKRMIEAGAEIYAYPGMAHGKVMVIDGKHTSIGTANLDALSLHKIAELNIVVDDPEFAQGALRDVFEVDLAKSRRLTIEDITFIQGIFGTAWRAFAGYL